MICKLYCVYDAFADNYGEPFVQVNDSAALRTFVARFANAESVQPDLKLCRLNDYDTDLGMIYDRDDTLCHDDLYTYEDAVKELAKARGELVPPEV